MKNPRRIAKERELLVQEVTQDTDEPNRLDFIVGLVSKRATTEFIGVEKTLTIRVPFHLAARIDALARTGGVSRNTLCVEMLEYAVEDVMGELDEATVKTVQDIEIEILAGGVE